MLLLFVEVCLRVLRCYECVLNASFGCATMGNTVYFVLRSRLLLYSAWSGVNRVQVVLSGFSVRLLCFLSRQKLYVCMVLCGIMVLLRAVLNMLVGNASLRGHMCFRCMMFSLSESCELLFLLCFIASWT